MHDELMEEEVINSESGQLPNPDTANANSRELLDVLMAHGVGTIVLSPGSRNAPLLIAASARRKLRKHIITDERTAAFVALGIGIVSRKPVALACTSGTALYNYAPAVAEAFYQKVPLIVITADRPAQWIDQDDSQTLRQPGALCNIVKRSYDIYAETGMSTPCANPSYESEREWFVNRVANEAVITATSGQPGPVHINMQFGNPLNRTRAYTPGKPRIIRHIVPNNYLPSNLALEFVSHIEGKKVMVVAGFMPLDHKLQKALQAFLQLENVTLLAETLSNLHVGGHAYMIDSLLTAMSKQELESLRPDVVITIGGALISRKLKEYLRRSPETEHWTLGDTDVSVDCLQRLSTHIEVSPAKFFGGVESIIRSRLHKGFTFKAPSYRNDWQTVRDRIWAANQERIKKIPFSELTALNAVFDSMPENCNLFLSNGTCVRYAQILTDKLPHACYCNRGVSGIDGTNATALGASIAYNGPTLLVTGDMSFAYCPEIMNLVYLGGDLKIVVVNNLGGGIFRFIPTTRDLDVTVRNEYFCADPMVQVYSLAKTYGWQYVSAESEEELQRGLEKLWQSNSVIMEIKVDADWSAEILRRWLNE